MTLVLVPRGRGRNRLRAGFAAGLHNMLSAPPASVGSQVIAT